MLDKENFESLFREHYQDLCFYAIRFVRDYDMSREIVQDCYIRLWEKRETIDLSKPVKSYLTTSVRNTCLNWLRDHRKFNQNLLDIEGLGQDPYDKQPDRLVEEEIRTEIKSAIEGLPEKCREIFVMNRYENLKYQEIANRLNISVKTVETQMSKALLHMRTKLREYLTTLVILVIGSLGH